MTRLFFTLILLASPAFADPSIQVAFSPRAGATDAVVQVISEAKQSIHLAAYGFTSKLIAQALIVAYQRGVEVEAVLDKSNDTAKRTEATELAAAGVPVRIDSRYAIMHDKFIVIDCVTVEAGSFNFTSQTEHRNAENVIVLRKYPEVARSYEAEWQRLWAESEVWGCRAVTPHTEIYTDGSFNGQTGVGGSACCNRTHIVRPAARHVELRDGTPGNRRGREDGRRPLHDRLGSRGDHAGPSGDDAAYVPSALGTTLRRHRRQGRRIRLAQT